MLSQCYLLFFFLLNSGSLLTTTVTSVNPQPSEKTPPILVSEVERALHEMKNENAPGENDIVVEPRSAITFSAGYEDNLHPGAPLSKVSTP